MSSEASDGVASALSTATTKSDFYGCYCLVSKSENRYYKGRTYIGFTVDPNRRIRQHNAGKLAGGAKKTDNRGPWDMVMIVHGFPNDKSALRFEWAWQHPDKSRRLKNFKLKKKPKESQFQFKFRILNRMLHTAPWRALKLTVRWLIEDYRIPFPPESSLPCHMSESKGLVPTQMTKQTSSKVFIPSRGTWTCNLCSKPVIPDLTVCPKTLCSSVYHLSCLADSFCGRERKNYATIKTAIIPTEGSCRQCGNRYHWFDIVAHKRKINAALGI